MAKKDYEYPGSKSHNVVSLVVFLVLFLVLVIWGMGAVAVGDPLWFFPTFQTKAAAIDLYWDGTKVTLQPGTPEHDLLQKAILAEFPQVQSWTQDAGMSDATLAELRQSGRLLEIYFDKPVRIHNQYQFGESTVYYVPLSGYNFARSRVYNEGRGGPLQLKSTQQLFSAAEKIIQLQSETGTAKPGN